MHFFTFLSAFLFLLRLRKATKTSVLYPKWQNLVNLSIWLVFILFFVIENYFDGAINGFLGSFLLFGILYYINKEPDFKAQQPFIYLHYPLVAVTIISSLILLIVPDFYDKWDKYFELAILGAFIWIFARSANSKKQQEQLRIADERKTELEITVAERTAELTKQKNELQETVKELQATQAQLIQQEKLASLGELTAGIAHEIQNPLNFVTNFSEVNLELIDEIVEELSKGNLEEAISISADLKQNLLKIRHHGQRADSIVKGMLQHSRSNGHIKETTNINILANEYLRLAYHGLRAKDKSFNVELITHLEEKLPTVNIISQDIGRVFLNLFNNAFYAIQKKQKTAGANYKPVVELNTTVIDETIQISVKDNGVGIPPAIIDKIMQPFFTTKPTGEGTGLGLSLSHDVIVKGHNGKIKITSKEGEYTEFIVAIPIN